MASTRLPLPAPPIILVAGALSQPGFGASGCPHALPGGITAHVHPSRLMSMPLPRMQTRACKYVRGPHLHTRPSRTAFSPRSGPGGTRVHTGRPAHRAPTDRHPKTGGRPGTRGGPAAESGQPPPRGDPASLGCVQRVSQAVARKPQGRPVSVGRVQGPAAPQRPPPTRPRPPPPPSSSSARAVHVSRTPREVRGLGPRSLSSAPRRSPAGAPERYRPREPRSRGRVEAAARLRPRSPVAGGGGSQELHHLGPGPARSIPGLAGRGALGQRRLPIPHAPPANSAQVSAPAKRASSYLQGARLPAAAAQGRGSILQRR